MDQRDQTDKLPEVLTMQIIACALIVGIVVFTGFALVQGAWTAPPQEGILKFLGLLLAVAMLPPWLAVPMFISAGGVQKSMSRQGQQADDKRAVLLGVYQTRMIVRFSLIEGAAFLNVFAFMTEHARWSLAVVLLLLLCMAAMVPTRPRVRHWLETESMRGAVEK